MPKDATKKRALALTTGVMGLGALYSRRRRRLESVANALHDTVSVAQEPSAPVIPEPIADEAHAPGHRHTGPPPVVIRHDRGPSWRRRADKNGHPGRFSG